MLQAFFSGSAQPPEQPTPACARKPSPGSTAADDAKLHKEKKKLKLEMRQWELLFEEENGGLIPTHEDKKHDERYAKIKAHAKRLEHSIESSRKATRKNLISEGQNGAENHDDGRGGSPIPSHERRRHYREATPGAAADLGSSTEKPVQAAASFAFEGGHMSLSPFHVLSLLVAFALPYAGFVMAFSLMGFGAIVFDYLVSSGSLFYPLSLSALALLVVLYIVDVSYWKHPASIWARRALLTIAGGTLVIGGTLASREYPYAPLLLLFLLSPAYWWLLYAKVLNTWPLADYLRAMCHALLLLSSVAAALWIAWVASGNNWDNANKRRYMLQMRCCTELEGLPELLANGGYEAATPLIGADESDILSHLNVTAAVATSSIWDGLRWPTASANVSMIGSPALLHDGQANVFGTEDGSLLRGAAVDESGCLVLPSQPCLSVLLFWSTPFVSAMAGLVAAILSALLGLMLRYDEQQSSGVLSVGGRVFILGIALAASSLWVSATISGASMGVSRVIMLGICALLLVMMVLVDRLFGWRAVLQASVTRMPLARRLVRFFITSDYSRAGTIAIAFPLLAGAVLLSVVNQFVRVHVLRAVVLPAERALWTTAIVDRILRRLRMWNWTSVLRKIIVLCIFYMVWVVGVMKIVTVLFSWLAEVLRPLPLALSTSVFAAVGMTMFLLPPVPGAPVYMASGVLLTASAQDRIGLWAAALYSIGVSFMIKILACALQQKAIGAQFKRSVYIRSAVMVNSPLMRALKLLMTRPEVFTRGKVATLVGGPDWPVSVMMGVLGMRLAPMLIGTTPVIFLVMPLSLSGSFLIQGPIAPFPSLFNLALAFSAVTQMGAFLAMMYYVERASAIYRAELEAMPYDLEVLALDRAEEEYGALYVELTSWQSEHVPRSMRVLLVIGALAAIASCQVSTFAEAHCFRDFSLYPDFSTQLRDKLSGSVSNIIKLPGYAVLGAIVVAFLCRYAFAKWATRLVRKKYAEGLRATHSVSRYAAAVATATAGCGRPCVRPPLVDVHGGTTGTGTAASAGSAQRPGSGQRNVPVASANASQCAAETAERPTAACGVVGGRKLSAKSKPFWQLEQERKDKAQQQHVPGADAAAAATAAASAAFASAHPRQACACEDAQTPAGGSDGAVTVPAPLERSNSACGSMPTKDRPGREHRGHHKRKHHHHGHARKNTPQSDGNRQTSDPVPAPGGTTVAFAC